MTLKSSISLEVYLRTASWSRRTKTATENEWVKLGHVINALSVTLLFAPYTFSCNIFNMLLSTGFKFGEFGGNSWDGANFWVFFCNNSMVARIRWAFPPWQGSVETLFRKLCTKFRHHRPIFIGNITKKHFGLISGHIVQLFQKCRRNKHVVDNDRYSQTYVESGLIFLVDDQSNFIDSGLRLRMLCAELITFIKHATGDHVRREVQRTCSQSRNGDRPQLTCVYCLKDVLD